MVANRGGWQMAAIRVRFLRASGFNDSGETRRVIVPQGAIYIVN